MRELELLLKEKEKENADLKNELTIVKKGDAHLQQTKELRFQFIGENRLVFPMVKMCKILEVSTSGFYKWMKAEVSLQAQTKARVMEQIAHEYEESDERCGSPKSPKNCIAKGFHGQTEMLVDLYLKESALEKHLGQI